MTNKEAAKVFEKCIELNDRMTFCINEGSPLYNACMKAIELLKAEPCDDAVSRAMVLDLKQTFYDNAGYETEYVDIEDIKALPPVTPKQKTGKWIYETGHFGNDMYDDSWYHIYRCSECGRTVEIDSQQYNKVAEKYPYCHCGAKMEGAIK